MTADDLVLEYDRHTSVLKKRDKIGRLRHIGQIGQIGNTGVAFDLVEILRKLGHRVRTVGTDLDEEER